MAKKIILILIILAILFFLSFFFLPKVLSTKYSSEGENISRGASLSNFILKKKEETFHLTTPKPVKAIYMTACVASMPNMRNELINFVDTSELNSVVIDIKDYTGTISFLTENKKLIGAEGPGCIVNDMKELIGQLHQKNIYIIGRITVFQDPFYAELKPELAVKKKSIDQNWHDKKGISYIDPGAKDYWEYIVELAKESYELGFDEINFDYIRFPSDGNMSDILFPHSQEKMEDEPLIGKQIILEDFFDFLQKNLKSTKMVTSADLFGMTTTNTDDLNIGQILEKTLLYFDYVAPMVYPSHYPPHFHGWSNPNLYPYDLIKFVLTSGVGKVENFKNATTTPENIKKRINKYQIRPWLQDFDYGGNYGVVEVQAQIQATYDSGLDSWMIWDPSNRYTRSAFLSQSSENNSLLPEDEI